MEQVSQYISGERDYVKLYGGTGPLVYPAAHVYIYRLLHYLTDEGRDVRLAQYIFIGLYLATLALVMQCYRQAKAPPYVFPLLILSKRLHSIFLLRLFNDGFTVFFLFLAIFCYQRKWWNAGSLAFSFGVGVKMSLLLALPAVGLVLWQGGGRNRAIGQAMLMVQTQVCTVAFKLRVVEVDTNGMQVMLGYPFLAANPRSYLSRAFELTRQFLFKWTVNWRFVGEETFLSRPFSLALLSAHATLLLAFLSTRWLKPAECTPLQAFKQLTNQPPAATQAKTAKRVTPDFVMTSILTAMLIGCLCARSLHYQFFAYIAWSTPFLLWRSGLHPVLIYLVWAAQEWAWNVYPSTSASSAVVVTCLAVTVAGAWLGTGGDGTAQAGKLRHEHGD